MFFRIGSTIGFSISSLLDDCNKLMRQKTRDGGFLSMVHNSLPFLEEKQLESGIEKANFKFVFFRPLEFIFN